MSNRDLIDPELVAALEAFPELNLDAATLPKLQGALMELWQSVPVPQNLPVHVEERTIPGAATGPAIRVLIYRPINTSAVIPAILHIHGGGYVIGAPEMQRLEHYQLCAELRCAIISVDYRLAPQHPHPAPIEDCYAALRWLHRDADALGIDPDRIAVSGESAGGGLAASLALMARDRGEVPIIFQHLIYPMIDDRTSTRADPHPYVGDFLWTRKSNEFGWRSLLGAATNGAGVSAYAAAARADNLVGLPPAFLATGGLDLFLEEDLEYARRLTRARVPVELHVYPGAYHGFGLAVEARVSIQAARDSREALRRALFG